MVLVAIFLRNVPALQALRTIVSIHLILYAPEERDRRYADDWAASKWEEKTGSKLVDRDMDRARDRDLRN